MKAVLALGIVCIAVALVNAEESGEPDSRQSFVVPVPAQQSVVAQPGFPVLGLAQQQQQQQMMQTIMLLFLIRRLRNKNNDDNDDDDGGETPCATSPDWYKARNGCYYRRFFSPPRTYAEAKAYCPTQCASTIAVQGMRNDFTIKTEIMNAVDFDGTAPGVWVGLAEESGVWKWDDGVPSTIYDADSTPDGSPFGNTNWDRDESPIEPDNTDGDCAIVSDGDEDDKAEFSTANCATGHAVLCELCM